ncbi:MAG: dUTP diphosphatase [Methylococcales bacterium]
MSVKLLSMLNMQNNMNLKVNMDWSQQNFAWYRAIWIESAELMDHHGWKWWKHQECDIDQVKLELIDIWHFGLSIIITDQGINEDVAADIDKQLQQALSNSSNDSDFLESVEKFASNTLSTRNFSVDLFADMMKGCNMDTDELYKRYVGKNVLNFFRQDHGYKDGTYIKEWSGMEDNEHLVEVVSELDTESSTFKDDIYASLLKRYRDLAL